MIRSSPMIHTPGFQGTCDTAMLVRVEELLMFDEKAAVEYLALLNSSCFMEPVMLSMSSQITYSRAINETADFFPQYIYPGSETLPGDNGLGFKRKYLHWSVMKGANRS
jgi:hypothetical protein